jgi:hypothetical protein
MKTGSRQNLVKPGIDCARLPREAMVVALPRKVDTVLRSANLPRVEPNRSGFLSRGEGISVCCVLSVASVKKTELTAGGIRCADYATPSTSKSWH